MNESKNGVMPKDGAKTMDDKVLQFSCLAAQTALLLLLWWDNKKSQAAAKQAAEAFDHHFHHNFSLMSASMRVHEAALKAHAETLQGPKMIEAEQTNRDEPAPKKRGRPSKKKEGSTTSLSSKSR